MMATNRRFVGILILVFVILSIPLVAMQFSHDVNWTVFDFLIAGILLFITGLTFEFIFKKIKKKKIRIVLFAVVTTLLFLIWIELAVGVFGTPFAGT